MSYQTCSKTYRLEQQAWQSYVYPSSSLMPCLAEGPESAHDNVTQGLCPHISSTSPEKIITLRYVYSGYSGPSSISFQHIGLIPGPIRGPKLKALVVGVCAPERRPVLHRLQANGREQSNAFSLSLMLLKWWRKYKKAFSEAQGTFCCIGNTVPTVSCIFGVRNSIISYYPFSLSECQMSSLTCQKLTAAALPVHDLGCQQDQVPWSIYEIF